MTFNADQFKKQLGGFLLTTLGDWKQWTGTTGELNQATPDYSAYINGNYNNNHGDDDKQYSYRSWHPECSCLSESAMILSLKIDLIGGGYDDHIILVVGFVNIVDQGPCMAFAQTSVQFANDDDQNIMSTPVSSNPPTATYDLSQAVYDDLQSKISDCNFSGTRNNVPYITQVNIQAMIGAVTA